MLSASKQASAAYCETVLAQMKRFCASRSTTGTSASGTTSQPRRQPVMLKYLLKLLMLMTWSSMRQRAVAEGFVVRQAQVDLVDQRDAAAPLHDFVDAAQFVGRDRGAGRVGRRREQHAARAFRSRRPRPWRRSAGSARLRWSAPAPRGRRRRSRNGGCTGSSGRAAACRRRPRSARGKPAAVPPTRRP